MESSPSPPSPSVHADDGTDGYVRIEHLSQEFSRHSMEQPGAEVKETSSVVGHATTEEDIQDGHSTDTNTTHNTDTANPDDDGTTFSTLNDTTDNTTTTHDIAIAESNGTDSAISRSPAVPFLAAFLPDRFKPLAGFKGEQGHGFELMQLDVKAGANISKTISQFKPIKDNKPAPQDEREKYARKCKLKQIAYTTTRADSKASILRQVMNNVFTQLQPVKVAADAQIKGLLPAGVPHLADFIEIGSQELMEVGRKAFMKENVFQVKNFTVASLFLVNLKATQICPDRLKLLVMEPKVFNMTSAGKWLAAVEPLRKILPFIVLMTMIHTEAGDCPTDDPFTVLFRLPNQHGLKSSNAQKKAKQPQQRGEGEGAAAAVERGGRPRQSVDSRAPTPSNTAKRRKLNQGEQRRGTRAADSEDLGSSPSSFDGADATVAATRVTGRKRRRTAEDLGVADEQIDAGLGGVREGSGDTPVDGSDFDDGDGMLGGAEEMELDVGEQMEESGGGCR